MIEHEAAVRKLVRVGNLSERGITTADRYATPFAGNCFEVMMMSRATPSSVPDHVIDSIGVRRLLRSITRRATGRKKRIPEDVRFLVEPTGNQAITKVADRVLGVDLLLETPTPLDRFTVAEVFSERAYSFDGMLRKPALLECLRQQAADGIPIIIDGGANIGASSILLAALYPAARIIAVEPEPRNVELHTRNCAGIQAISLVPAAIGPADGEAMLSAGDNPRGHHLSVEGNVKVRVVSIESLLAPIHRGIPFMLKLDIEGAEELLFADEAPWIDRFPVIVIEPHDRKYPKSSKIRAFLRHLGARDRDFLIEGENIVSISNALVG